MKKFLLVFTMVISFLYQSTLLASTNKNYNVIMGELTGAGSKFTLNSVVGFVHPSGYILNSDCQHIEVKSTSTPMVSDVVSLTINNSVISANELIGFIVEK